MFMPAPRTPRRPTNPGAQRRMTERRRVTKRTINLPTTTAPPTAKDGDVALSLEKGRRRQSAASEGSTRPETCALQTPLTATRLSLVKRSIRGENSAASKSPAPDTPEPPERDMDASPSRRAPGRIDLVVARPAVEQTSPLLACPRPAPILPVSRTEIALLRAHLGPAIDAILFDGENS